jgi:prophage antirepressor-like protein
MEIQIFKNAEFGEVRTLTGANGEVLFCGADIAKALGYANSRKALADHCKNDGVTNRYIIDSIGRQQEAKFINEGNLYRLIAHSKLPSAERFESWVFDEVLPTIRKHGAYMTENTLEKALTSPDFLIQLATQLKEEQAKRKQLEEQAEQDRPKVLFANAVETSKTSILVGELAKILKQNGVDTGQKRLFKWLRDHGFLIKREGTDYNMPTQRAMEQGLFEIKESTVIHADGHTSVTKTPKVTGKGQTYFVNKFLS